jgi:hypothetical protein
VAGIAGISTKTEAEVTRTTAARAGACWVDGGTVTCTRVGGSVRLAVADGTATVARMGWLWSLTPETLTVLGAVVVIVVTGGVTSVSVTATWCNGGRWRIKDGVQTVTIKGRDGTVTVAGSPMVTIAGSLRIVSDSRTGGMVSAEDPGLTATDDCTGDVAAEPDTGGSAIPTWIGVPLRRGALGPAAVPGVPGPPPASERGTKVPALTMAASTRAATWTWRRRQGRTGDTAS